MEITEPGIYDIPDAIYHANPCPDISLSASGIKQLVTVGRLKGCPAKFLHWSMNPSESKDAFDLGRVAHSLVLGAGADYQTIEANDRRSKKTQEEIEAIRARGMTPILRPEFDRANAMMEALFSDERVASLFANGEAEKTIIWEDDVWCRARPDYMIKEAELVIDYKTCSSADLLSIEKAIDEFGYYVQAAFYNEGIRAVKLMENPTFLFVFQEKDPPHVCTVVQIDQEAVSWGEIVVAKAKRVLRQCLDTKKWPGYSDGIAHINLPRYRRYEFEESTIF